MLILHCPLFPLTLSEQIAHWKPEGGAGSPGTGVSGGCEVLNMEQGNQSLVLYKSSVMVGFFVDVT